MEAMMSKDRQVQLLGIDKTASRSHEAHTVTANNES